MYRRVARRLTLRIVIALTICIALLPIPNISLLISGTAQGQREERKVKPRPGKPEGEFPDLEDAKHEALVEREAQPPIPSTIPSRRNSGKPWDGKKVGDPPGLLDQNGAERGNGGPDLASKRVTERRNNQTRRAHARARMTPPTPPPPYDQFVTNFFTFALVRSPYSNETTYWYDQLRRAYTNGSTSMKLAAIEFGRTLFESAEYAARNRNAHDYVYDLYKTYLMRDPDSGGWAFWEALVPTHGREYVRRGFEESTEFATLTANITISGSPTSNTSLISARVGRRNQPGYGMLARDASWSVPLLSLPGRAGLDLGLSLAYSSMVWTRSGPYIYFDEDNGFPSPGFRLGFPTVQRKVFNAETAKNAYLMITAAGKRVELRQVDTSNIYDAADSSYLRLTDNGGTLLVHSIDGTKMSFSEINNEWRCVEIKDRNGNYITVNYNTLGRISTITETLGRVITFNYDSNSNLTSITQAWNGQPSHQWVSFGWGTRTMQYSFSDSNLRGVIGTANSTDLPVITQVGLNDTSHFTFDYTNSLQVSAIKNYFGSLERNATIFTYEGPSGDVARLQDSRVSARNWTGVNNVPSQVITTYSVGGDGACIVTAPDGTIYKEYYGTGWQKGLTTLSEVWSGGQKVKWTTTAWTQDNTGVSYETNPRVIETNVYDPSSNRRRSTIEYGQYSLPTVVHEFAANAVDEIRQTYTFYDLSSTYVNLRIIGLISEVQVKQGSAWVSKITYGYDDPARLHGVPAAATRHDVNYNLSFTARGNVTSVSRWDATDPTNATKKLTSYTNYYNTGSPISSTDPSGHQSNMTYADSFSDSVNRNTFAYPTTITDAGGYSSYLQYNFDFGANTRRESPAPAGQSQGAIQTMTYNNLGQMERTTTTNNNAYKRFWYAAEFTASYSTINNATDESYSLDLTDGMGRVIGAATNHPGSGGGYILINTVYNQMGQVRYRSNPTEVNSSWTPSGDDSAGIYYTHQTYDWQGRPLVTTNPDNTTREASYSGCGCAGGQVVTLTDEGTIDGGVAKRRQQKIYSDVLGRTSKTEILNWQNGSVYSAAINTYNARDQLELVRRYDGVAGGGSYQDTTMTYDGYGRLKTKHSPEQNTSTVTTWNYNADDTIQSVVDARGASSTYSYNSRHLMTGVVYSGGNGTTPNISYGYDAAGNRTSMTDGLGTVTYTYDQLSRLTQESRYFSGLNQTYAITSGYNLANQLTSVGTPFSSQSVGYTYDAAGRIDAVTGNGYSDVTYQGFWPNWYPVTTQVTTIASNIQQRASGAIKQMTYGNGGQLTLAYNSRLAQTSMQLSNFAGQTFTATYSYYNDGRIKLATDATYNLFDRLYRYDHVGRYKEALSGDEARGGTTADGPYRQNYSYDVWGNTTSFTNRVWTLSPVTTNPTYTNNRRTGWSYDANGYAWSHSDGSQWYVSGYDAVSRRNYFEPTLPYVGGLPAVEMHYTYDGNSVPTKTVDIRRTEDWETQQVTTTTSTSYSLHSSALGGKTIADLDAQGNKVGGYIYLNGMVLGIETASWFPSYHPIFWWQHTDPVTGTSWTSNVNGGFWGGAQVDPLGTPCTTPPEPEIIAEPSYTNPKNSEFWPMEIGGWDAGRTNEMEIGMAQYIDTRDMIMAREAWLRGDRDRAQRILAANPNVGMIVSGAGAAYLAQQADFDEANADGSFTFWGANAANALGFVTDRGTVAKPKPPTIPTASFEEHARFDAAYEDAVDRLTKRKECAAVFGGLRNAFKALRETVWRFGDLGKPKMGFLGWEAPTGARVDGNNVTINQYGQFMVQGGGLWFPGMKGFVVKADHFAIRTGKNSYNTVQIRGNAQVASFMLLHELGHRAGVFGPDSVGGVGQEAENLRLQGTVNQKVYEGCFK